MVHLLRPPLRADPTWNYAVLGAAAAFEGISRSLALKGFLAPKGDRGVWRAIRRSKDPDHLRGPV